ncbi:hypothetical protein CKF54_04000 [Psittacicella hinzii]|uniref:Cytolethal distending toxin subunit A n=1 Tax=Psittacicella hinzii TaxID=2028575 RepID=A0A3A1Y9Q0_9GAMM|nr:hypothetical protein [Psittacicella hinzii]RIY32864.1 hypothetical protein CKF54_04000 [Psittacicella hinzii]
MKIKLLTTMMLGTLLAACGSSSNLGKFPTPPGEVSKIVGALPNSNSRTLTDQPLVSIMSHTSGVITVWATAPNNWLWGYSPFDSQSFGDLRNWYFIKNSNGSVSFRNLATGTCMAAYGNRGIVHVQCNPQSLEQQFDLLPLSNRAVAIKSASNSQCLRTDLFRKTVYMSLTFAPCIVQGQMTQEQQWFITPPIQRAFPIPLAS